MLGIRSDQAWLRIIDVFAQLSLFIDFLFLRNNSNKLFELVDAFKWLKKPFCSRSNVL